MESNKGYYERPSVALGLQTDAIRAGEDRMAQWVRQRAGHTLDIGCGSGRLHLALQGPGLVGVDFSTVQLEAYRRSYPEACLVAGSATRLPFASGTFDTVVMSYHLIESIFPREQRFSALSEARRVMADANARLVLTRHIARAYHLREQIADRLTGRVAEFGDYVGRGASRAGGNDLSGLRMHLLGEREMATLARRAGFGRSESWDFDTGGNRGPRSVAVVEVYRPTAVGSGSASVRQTSPRPVARKTRELCSRSSEKV